MKLETCLFTFTNTTINGVLLTRASAVVAETGPQHLQIRAYVTIFPSRPVNAPGSLSNMGLLHISLTSSGSGIIRSLPFTKPMFSKIVLSTIDAGAPLEVHTDSNLVRTLRAFSLRWMTRSRFSEPACSACLLRFSSRSLLDISAGSTFPPCQGGSW